MNLDQILVYAGNQEYCTVMNAIDETIIIDDKMDEHFINNYLKLLETWKPIGFFVSVNIGNIGIITLDNIDSSTVKSKLYIHNF